MKEATGELSTTAIAIVAIAAILAIFTTILLPMIRSQITLTQACNSGPGYTSYHENGKKSVNCGSANNNNQFTCTTYDTNEKQTGTKTCSVK